MALVVPNSQSALGLSPTGDPVKVSVEWQRAFMSWVGAIPVSGTVSAFAGATVPNGWVHDTTVGLPALPAGYMWIKKL